MKVLFLPQCLRHPELCYNNNSGNHRSIELLVDGCIGTQVDEMEVRNILKNADK